MQPLEQPPSNSWMQQEQPWNSRQAIRSTFCAIAQRPLGNMAKSKEMAMVFGGKEAALPEEESSEGTGSEYMAPSFDDLAAEVLPGVEPDAIRSLFDAYMEERGGA